MNKLLTIIINILPFLALLFIPFLIFFTNKYTKNLYRVLIKKLKVKNAFLKILIYIILFMIIIYFLFYFVVVLSSYYNLFRDIRTALYEEYEFYSQTCCWGNCEQYESLVMISSSAIFLNWTVWLFIINHLTKIVASLKDYFESKKNLKKLVIFILIIVSLFLINSYTISNKEKIIDIIKNIYIKSY